jgi:hypothetical protein
MFFAGGLGATAAVGVLTGSESADLLVVLVLWLGVYPVLTARFGTKSEYFEAVRERNVPNRVAGASLLFLVPWALLVVEALPDLGLGAGFWSLVVLWPWLEVWVALGERDLRRRGRESWKPIRPRRDALLTGLAILPTVTAIGLLSGASLGEAVLAGVACAVLMSILVAALIWLFSRAEGEMPGDEPHTSGSAGEGGSLPWKS